MKILILSILLLFLMFKPNVLTQEYGECFTASIDINDILMEKGHSVFDHECLNSDIFSDSLYNYDFIPTLETPPKYVRVNLQVIQDENGENNFQENNPDHLYYLNRMFSTTWSESVNGYLENLDTPLYQGEEGDYYI